MRGIVNVLLVCLIAVVLILPIGIGAWTGLSNSNEDVGGSSQGGEELDVGVSLSETEIGCNIGAVKTLTATTVVESDSYIFQWSISDKAIATVRRSEESDRSCLITALKDGTAVVTVNVIDKSKFKIVDSATCNITVINSNIQFSQSEVIISLDKGNSATISAKAPDDGEITWSSQDESIATVEGGVITAHKAGQVYIIAKSGAVEGKVLVKIYNSIITLEDAKQVSVGSSATIGVNGTLGEGAVWTSADERIATVDQNGVVTGVKAGMTTVKVSSATDDQTATCVVIVKRGNEEVINLVSGKKAEAAANPGNWYYLCESNIVTIGSTPTLDNGLISLDITGIGESGANMFYLRYQVDDVGDVVYKQILYIYSANDDVLIQVNGVDNTLKKGINRIENEYTSDAPGNGNPFQIKFKGKGVFYVLPVFEEISRIEKLVLSENYHTLNTSDNNSFTLSGTIPGKDNPEIKWTSSNESVCTVVNGVVTAVGEGQSMITAVSGNLTANCLVTVSDKPIKGTSLASGNKTATVEKPGNWFYLADGKSKIIDKPIMDSDGNIHMSISNIDRANKKYVYLRYQPETAGVTYKVTVTIDFAGENGTAIDFTGGNISSAVTHTVNNGTNVFEFEFTSDSKNPLQMKFYGIGGYVINVTFSEV